MAVGKKGPGCAGRQRRCTTADSATLEDQCHPRKIFIGGLASNTATQDLRLYFERFGSIVDAVVLRWPDGRSRGFGYVTFAETSAASAALAGSHVVGGQEVDVKRAVPGTNKLFVGGLPQNTMAAELREHFEAFGIVSDAVVMIDPATGRSRGFGFVCFAPGQEGAAAVAAALHQYKSHRIRGKWIEVKSAAPPHKFVSQESSGDAAPGCAPAAAPAFATMPLLAPAAPMESGMTQILEDLGEAPLPKLLGPAGWAHPQKVALPAGIPGAIGAPPGLDDVVKDPCKGGAVGPSAETAAYGVKGFVPWPGARAALAYPMLWPDAAPALGDHLGLGPSPPLPPPPGRFESGVADGGLSREAGGVGARGDLSTALQQSLEQLVRLKMRDSSEEAAHEGVPPREQLVVA